jgi:hypothetical protein
MGVWRMCVWYYVFAVVAHMAGMCGMCVYVCTLHIMASYHKGGMGVCMRVHAHCVQAMLFHKGRHGQAACVYTCLGTKSSCSEGRYGCMSARTCSHSSSQEGGMVCM